MQNQNLQSQTKVYKWKAKKQTNKQRKMIKTPRGMVETYFIFEEFKKTLFDGALLINNWQEQESLVRILIARWNSVRCKIYASAMY